MICVEPSHAQHLIQNIKNNPKIIPKSSKNGVQRPSKNASEKRLQKHITKIAKKLKMNHFRVPPWGGTNGERTNFWWLFRFRAPLGHPWGTPGGQNGPKTSPKSLRDPPEPILFMIVCHCLMICWSFVAAFSDVFGSLFGVIFFIILRCVFDIVSYKVVALRGALTPQP